MEYYSAFKKKEILPFETWLSLVGMTLSDTSQTEKDKYSVIDPGRAVLMGVIQADAGAGEERVSRQPCKPWFPNLQSRGGDFLSRSDDP